MMLGVTVVAALVVAFAVADPALSGDVPPNIIILLTDDQDTLLNSTMVMPHLKALVRDKGVSFTFGLANSPVCCPSRSSLLSGRFIHNHGAVNNTVKGNCYGAEWQSVTEQDALAVHLQKAGYTTLYGGKYLNDYFGPKVPPGWTQWFGLHGNSRYYNYTIQDNDKAVNYGDSYQHDYLTDVLKRRALTFINEQSNEDGPFFLWIGTPAAHAGFTPAPQYFDTGSTLKAPRTPNYNRVYEDKHETLRELKPMNQTEIDQSDKIFGQRLGTLRSVDDMVADIFSALEANGQLNNTWFFYTGDHGFHLGQFAMGFDKRQLYETDIRVPYFVRGPGSLMGVSRNEPISHVDLAATVIDLATGNVPSEWDGRSYKDLLVDASATWKDTQLIQYFGESATTESCGANFNAYQNDNNTCWYTSSYIPAPCDGVNNTYSCIRRVAPDLSINDIFCEFECFNAAHNVVPCPMDQAEGYGEYYDLKTDPWQTKNMAKTIPASLYSHLSDLVNGMKNCSGQTQCQGSTSTERR